MKKIKLIVSLLILGIFLFGSLDGLRFKEINVIPGDVKIVRSEEINDFGKAVLFEDNQDKTFGIAGLKKEFRVLYRYGISTDGYWIEEGKPFTAAGIGDSNYFVVAVKTARESNIKYVALGNHMESVMPLENYELSLENVKANLDGYHLKEVTDNYVLFVLDEYSEDTWTIRAFSKDGDLVADKLFGGEARFIDRE
ncbi:hypothetical protein SAMN05428987_5506 [Paenibacillus sp. CF095]|uniref:hypothetical protein n=1 Tax=unclassified Paenibacillus TaxID=185978 RepID=UPI00088A4BBF|nr:hypothetical protein [Paenibacillus sp. CF095]SDD64239.1 hypothetical protein SAMN05428987_5506 [Paenibacillus sp. CF095]